MKQRGRKSAESLAAASLRLVLERRKPQEPEPPRFSDAAIEAFRKMRELEEQCTCEPRDWEGEYWKHRRCVACDAWWEQHAILADELDDIKLWQWPVVETPGAVPIYPEGSRAARIWKPDLEAQERWRALEQALVESEDSSAKI
jgi:hypothetical protein